MEILLNACSTSSLCTDKDLGLKHFFTFIYNYGVDSLSLILSLRCRNLMLKGLNRLKSLERSVCNCAGNLLIDRIYAKKVLSISSSGEFLA